MELKAQGEKINFVKFPAAKIRNGKLQDYSSDQVYMPGRPDFPFDELHFPYQQQHSVTKQILIY